MISIVPSDQTTDFQGSEKETFVQIRINRLLPSLQLNETRYRFGDWILKQICSFWRQIQDLLPKNALAGIHISSLTRVLNEKACGSVMPLSAGQTKHSTDDKKISAESKEGLYKLREVNHAHLSSGLKLACSSRPPIPGVWIFLTLVLTTEDKYPINTTDILDNAKAYTKYDTSSTYCERVDQVSLEHEIPSVSDPCLEDKGVDKPDTLQLVQRLAEVLQNRWGCSVEMMIHH